MDGHFVPNIETIDAFNGSDLEAQILCGLLSINVNVKSGCVPNWLIYSHCLQKRYWQNYVKGVFTFSLILGLTSA